jgi:hypothetical protein
MKKSILTLFAALLILTALVPYFIGLINHQAVIKTCQNFTERTDSDINDVLFVYGFDLTWDEEPQFTDFYRSGYRTIITYNN